MVTVVSRSLRCCKKIACISDIHGNFRLMQRLLAHPAVASADIVIFDGDYISRGRESLSCVRWLMSVYGDTRYVILRGNMDRVADWYTYGEPEAIMNHMADHRFTLFAECMREQNAGVTTALNLEEQRRIYTSCYREEISFLHGLPNVLETEQFLFLHGGLPADGSDWSTASQHAVMKNDSYIFNGKNPTGKWVVAGHIPAWNAPLSKNSNNCLVDVGKHSVFIDGGNQVKRFAQLNALIIDRVSSVPAFSTVFVSDYPVVRATASADSTVPYPFYKPTWPYSRNPMQITERRGDFVRLCSEDGNIAFAHSGHLKPVPGGWVFAVNTLVSGLKVAAGEPFELLDVPMGDTVFVRNSAGMVGWIPKAVLQC